MRIEILQIEDNPGDARLVKEMLAGVKSVQFELTHARSLNDGLKLLSQKSFDVVLLDLSLPDAQGMDSVVRTRAASDSVPIVVMSSLSDEQSAINAVQTGAQDYLVKGRVDGDALVRSVRYSIERKRLLQEREQLLNQLRLVNGQLTVEAIRVREQADQAERQAAQMSALLKNMTNAVVVLDAAGRVLLRNQAASDLAGEQVNRAETIEDFRSSRLYSLKGVLIPFEQSPVHKLLRGEQFSEEEFFLERPDGSRCRIVTSGTIVLDERGKVDLAIIISRDVTQLRELEQLKEEYVSLISHDLRNPLSVMMSWADWLHRLLLQRDLPREASSAEAILRSTRRMNAMIQDLVETTRLEAGQFELHEELTDLFHLVTEMVTHFASAEDQARIRVESPEWVPPVPADTDRLERAIMNLALNALKYSPPETPVVIRIGRREGEAVISVMDQGVGIAPEEQPYLFDRFYRAKTGKKTGGLGLGLYISRLIVEAHGGEIWVESQPGKGTTFSFTLPLGQP